MRLLTVAVCGLMFTLVGGCTTTDGMTMFKNRDYADPASGPDDPWISNVGEEVEDHGVRRSETSGEPKWFREFTMSDRAREIENNLGISD